MSASLDELGFVPFFSQQTSLDEIEHGRVMRVSEVQRSQITLMNGVGEQAVQLTSSLLAGAAEERPTVGDWVVLSEQRDTIDRVLERKSLFRRVAAGQKSEVQLIAANIDVLFLVTSCNEEFNESRLERYLALAVESGAIPVVVLTKADLSDDPDSFRDCARRVRSGVSVESVNALDRTTLNGVLAWIQPGSTVALVGSSGVGKSTLVNTLAESDIAETSHVRQSDQKGRHTTSHRALHRLPNGGLIIDVPGMRELKVANVNDALAAVFDDIQSLARQCRFADCRHEEEPGCAVCEAIARGDIDSRRLENYRKLMRESKRHGASLAERRSEGRAFGKLAREAMAIKAHNKGRSK